ncbi:cortexin-2-like [Arapaima gigas]
MSSDSWLTIHEEQGGRRNLGAALKLSRPVPYKLLNNKGVSPCLAAPEGNDGAMDQPAPLFKLEVDVDLGFALFFLFLLCFFLLVTMVRCAQMVVDPYSAISTSTYQEEQINN